MTGPAFEGYLADPFVLRLPDGGYAAYGSSGAPVTGPSAFESLYSSDLVSWESRGPVLERPDAGLGEEYWAPEVAFAEGAYWLYYSVGHGIEGHHLRVARSDSAFGPFVDLGHNLTPGESFAIDANPFLDEDGSRYLFFARDVLDAERPGTQLAVAPMVSMTELGAARTVLEPNADWQLYQRDRAMYGDRYDWHTLEGPAVVRRNGRYWVSYSGGAWTGAGYAVSWAVADAPLGPWRHAPAEAAPLLATESGLIGPGHNSFTVDPNGRDVIVFHSWDEARTVRRMHLHHISFMPEGPRVDGPIRGSSIGEARQRRL